MPTRFLPVFLVMPFLQLWNNIASGQYFYKDIWNPQQLSGEMAILKNEKIKTVTVKSFDDNGEPSEGFFCEKKISKGYALAETVTRSNVTSQSLLTSRFDPKGVVIETTDSTDFSINRTIYGHDNEGRLISVKTFTKAEDDTAAIEEVHTYIYNSAGSLEKMLLQKNNIESATVVFTTDENGNVTEEEEIPVRGTRKKYFYYYDDKNRLTDVVHYNERAKRLLPDYMYAYNDLGEIKQMISIEEGGGYYIWNYSYNGKKLRDMERCLSKEKKLLGSVQYIYQ